MEPLGMLKFRVLYGCHGYQGSASRHPFLVVNYSRPLPEAMFILRLETWQWEDVGRFERLPKMVPFNLRGNVPEKYKCRFQILFVVVFQKFCQTSWGTFAFFHS